MARFETQDDENEANAFLHEKGIKVDLLSTRCDDYPRRSWYDVTIYSPRGRVTYSDYSPAPGSDIYDDALILSDLIAFTEHVTEYENADDYAEQGNDPEEFHAMVGRAEVLQAITGHDIEYLASLFSTY